MRLVPRKISLLLSLGLIILFPLTANAQSVEQLLKAIDEKAGLILLKIEQAAEAWSKPDASDTTSNLQEQFSEYGKQVITNINSQHSPAFSKAFSDDLFINNAINTSLLTNEISYYALMNQPYLASKTEPKTPYAYSYLLNAGGIKIQHPIETASWAGAKVDQQRYRNYFNSVLSIQSYNGYILSHLYADSQNKNGEAKLRSKLISMATDGANWFEKIASEPIGVVLRQILMFESQSFVLLSQMLDTQKQLLTATVMNNTLLILLNQNNEQTMWAKANTAGTS